MSAGRYDTIIEQGATFSRTCTWKDSSGVGINLTGYTVAGKIKRNATDNTPLLSFTVSIANQGTFPGKFTISLTAAQTSTLPTKPGNNGVKELLPLSYDIEATTGSVVVRLFEGILNNSAQVTT